MKFSQSAIQLVLALSSGTVTAFHGIHRTKPGWRGHSLGQSTVVEADATTTPEATAPKKKVMPTRFDKFKKTYKGARTLHKIEDGMLDFSYDDFAKAVEETEYAFERNSVVEGVAVEYSGNGGCLVDIGAKSSAFLPEQEVALVNDGTMPLEEMVPLDTTMDFQIISEEDENGQLIVSLKRIQFRKAWESIQKLAAEDAVLEAPVIAVNRGGAICLVEGLRAFMPGSHLAGQMADENLVGQVLKVKFLEVAEENNKLVVSNRKAIVEQQMADLSRGDVVAGIVKAIKPYGAFVEVGGMSGLLHISQISYDRIDDLETVLQPGMPVKCMIIDHDKVNGRIALSTKTLETNPGDMLNDSAKVFENAEEAAERYHKKMEEERLAREEAARGIVMGLSGDTMEALDEIMAGSASAAADIAEGDGTPVDPLQDVSDSLDSLLS